MENYTPEPEDDSEIQAMFPGATVMRSNLTMVSMDGGSMSSTGMDGGAMSSMGKGKGDEGKGQGKGFVPFSGKGFRLNAEADKKDRSAAAP